MWPSDLRQEVLELTRRPFCAFGYDRLLVAKMGEEKSGIGSEFCRGVDFDSGEKMHGKSGMRRLLR